MLFNKRFDCKGLDLSTLKTGDLICERKPLSAAGVLIRFAINLNKPKHLRSPYNHIAMVVMVSGKPFIAEAIGSGFGRLTSAKCWVKNRIIAIRRPKFEFSRKQFNADTIGTAYESPKYDYKGTFYEQALYQLFGYKKNKSEVEGDKKLYCSEAYARFMNKQLPSLYENYYLIDPQDLYVDDNYTTTFEGKVK